MFSRSLLSVRSRSLGVVPFAPLRAFAAASTSTSSTSTTASSSSSGQAAANKASPKPVTTLGLQRRYNQHIPVKRPVTAFGQFVKSTTGDGSTMVERAARWRSMNQRERQTFVQMAQKAKADYVSALEAFKRNTPPPPKRPLSSFMRFVQERRAAVMEKNPSASLGEVSKIIAAEYRRLSDDAKAALRQGYQNDMQLFKNAYDNWLEQNPEAAQAVDTKAIRARERELAREKRAEQRRKDQEKKLVLKEREQARKQKEKERAKMLREKAKEKEQKMKAKLREQAQKLKTKAAEAKKKAAATAKATPATKKTAGDSKKAAGETKKAAGETKTASKTKSKAADATTAAPAKKTATKSKKADVAAKKTPTPKKSAAKQDVAEEFTGIQF